VFILDGHYFGKSSGNVDYGYRVPVVASWRSLF